MPAPTPRPTAPASTALLVSPAPAGRSEARLSPDSNELLLHECFRAAARVRRPCGRMTILHARRRRCRLPARRAPSAGVLEATLGGGADAAHGAARGVPPGAAR